MIDQAKASILAAEAFEQWQAGRHEHARRYEEAIPLTDPQHFALSLYYGQYAGVLNAPASWLTRFEEACILQALDRKAEARQAAALAIAHAPGPEKAEELRQRLKEILGGSDSEE